MNGNEFKIDFWRQVSLVESIKAAQMANKSKETFIFCQLPEKLLNFVIIKFL